MPAPEPASAVVATPREESGRFVRYAPPIFYLAVTLLFVWPLPMRLATHVVSADSPDIWIHLWWMWQVRESVLHGQNPYETVRVFHPTGAPLYLMGQDMVTAILSIPFQGLFGLVATYNLFSIAAIAFAAWTMYLLALDVTGSRPGALVAGAIFGFAPLQAAFLNLGQMEFVNLGFLPLAVLFLLRLRRDRRPWVPLLGGVWVALTVYSSWYQALFLALIAAFFIAYEVLGLACQRRWRALRPFALALVLWGGAALVLVSPALLPTIRLAATSSFAVTARFNISYSSIDLFDPFKPDRLNPLFGAARSSTTAALGYVALALAAVGLWHLGRRGRFWGLLIAIFYLLALGPYLKIGQRMWDLPVLPYNILYRLPMGNISRVPSRFLMVITLAISILAAAGVAWLMTWLAARRPRRAALVRAAVPTLALLLVLAEVFPAPRALADASIEPFYATLASDPAGAVYEVPYDDRAVAMYRATAHKHPLVGGYVSRPVPYPLLNGVPVITQIRNRADTMLQELSDPDIIHQTALVEQGVAIFDAYDIRYVILRRDSSVAAEHPNQAADLARTLDALLRADQVIYDDGPMKVYRIPHAARSGVIAGLGPGWYPQERRADTGQRFRWADGEALLTLTLLDDAPRTATMTASLFSYTRPATVDVWLNDRLVTTIVADPAARSITLDLPLTHGYNALRLRAREAPLRPSDVGGARDDRALSFALAEVRLTVP